MSNRIYNIYKMYTKYMYLIYFKSYDHFPINLDWTEKVIIVY